MPWIRTLLGVLHVLGGLLGAGGITSVMVCQILGSDCYASTAADNLGLASSFVTCGVNVFMAINLNCCWRDSTWLYANKVLTVELLVFNIGTGTVLSVDDVISSNDWGNTVLQACTWTAALLMLITGILYFTRSDISAESQAIVTVIHYEPAENQRDCATPYDAIAHDVTTSRIIDIHGINSSYSRPTSSPREENLWGGRRIPARPSSPRRIGYDATATSRRDDASRLSRSAGDAGPHRVKKSKQPKSSNTQTVGFSSRESSPNHPTSWLLRPNSVK